jgi:hypothetical protein
MKYLYVFTVLCALIYSLLCRLNINHVMDNWNMHLFLAPYAVRWQTQT